MDSIYSKFRIVSSIHRGLYDAWLFGFFLNDTPSKLVKPEYLATVKVGEAIGKRVIKDSGNTKYKLRLEERANDVASHCFQVPPYPFRKRKIRSRSGRKGHERIDVTLFRKIGFFDISKAVIELKLSSLPCHLRPDLSRNKVLMELKDEKKENNLALACLGFIVVDELSVSNAEGKVMRNSLKKKYQKLANDYLSNEYLVHVSVSNLCSPPGDEDSIGEFIHMVSVVISFFRKYSPNKAV